VTSSLFAFTETIIFTEGLHDLTDDETLFMIQKELLENPLRGDVMKGTSGARKARMSDRASGKGKRGGFRYIYIYLQKAGRIYLLDIYSKSEKTDLTPKQAKELGEVVKAIKKIYGEK